MALLENFEKIIKDVVNEKKIHLSSFGWDRMKRIGRGLKRGETKAADVIKDLQQEKEIRLSLNGSDWRELERKIEKILR
jgi:hypothetical protein